MEFLYRPIETWLEGTPGAAAAADAPLGRAKLARKAASGSSLALSRSPCRATFVAYFVSWPARARDAGPPAGAHATALGVLAFVAAAMLFDFGYFRDQMCTVACPYGRLQTVLVDDDTILVAYDGSRGEPRAKPKQRHDEAGPTATASIVAAALLPARRASISAAACSSSASAAPSASTPATR